MILLIIGENNTNDVELPLVNYQSVGRVWNQKHNLDNIFREKYLRTVGYVDTFTDLSNRDLFLNWCVKMEQIAWQKKQEIREYEAVKKAAADFMKYMDDSDLDYTVSYDRQFECIVFDDGKNITPNLWFIAFSEVHILASITGGKLILFL